MQKSIPYSMLTVKDMFKLYNEHARRLLQPLLKYPLNSRVEMAKALALLVTHRTIQGRPVAKPKSDKQLLRDVVAEALCEIAFYERVEKPGVRVEVSDADIFEPAELISFGFPYGVVLEKILKRLPTSKISAATLRVHVANIRDATPGYESAGRLPDKRPYSNKGQKSQ